MWAEINVTKTNAETSLKTTRLANLKQFEAKFSVLIVADTKTGQTPGKPGL
jgi:hypothetical protein